MVISCPAASSSLPSLQTSQAQNMLKRLIEFWVRFFEGEAEAPFASFGLPHWHLRLLR